MVSTPRLLNHHSMKTFICILFCFGAMRPLMCRAQSERSIFQNAMGLQYGFSLKCSIEFGFGHGNPNGKPYTPKSSLRVSASGGVSSNFIINELHPSLNVDLMLYCGGLGSRLPGDDAQTFNLDVVTAFTLTAGIKNLYRPGNEGALQYRLVPLYYFTNFTTPSLQNPYDYSLSLGTDWIVSTDPQRSHQRVGFLNLNFHTVQISYYNDGGTVMADLNLGDRRDRYYTGGGVISYHGRSYEVVNLVEISFDKFTGFTKNTFETSNALDLAFVNYHEKRQGAYNKSLYTINVANVEQGWCAFVKSYNWSALDAQHGIHRSLFNSFHIVPYESFVAVGGQYFYNHLQSAVR